MAKQVKAVSATTQPAKTRDALADTLKDSLNDDIYSKEDVKHFKK